MVFPLFFPSSCNPGNIIWMILIYLFILVSRMLNSWIPDHSQIIIFCILEILYRFQWLEKTILPFRFRGEKEGCVREGCVFWKNTPVCWLMEYSISDSKRKPMNSALCLSNILNSTCYVQCTLLKVCSLFPCLSSSLFPVSLVCKHDVYSNMNSRTRFTWFEIAVCSLVCRKGLGAADK